MILCIEGKRERRGYWEVEGEGEDNVLCKVILILEKKSKDSRVE